MTAPAYSRRRQLAVLDDMARCVERMAAIVAELERLDECRAAGVCPTFVRNRRAALLYEGCMLGLSMPEVPK